MPKPLTPEEEEMIREHSRPYSEPKKSMVFKNMLLFADGISRLFDGLLGNLDRKIDRF